MIDGHALVELASTGKASEFKDAMSTGLSGLLGTVKTNLDTAVRSNIMGGGEIQNFNEVVGIEEDVPDEQPEEDTAKADEPISFT